MFDRNHQRLRVKEGKIQKQDPTFAQMCFLGIFKYLMHCFVLCIILAFAGMLYVVSESREKRGFDSEIDLQVSALSWFLEHNPAYYGIKQKTKGKLDKSLKKVVE